MLFALTVIAMVADGRPAAARREDGGGPSRRGGRDRRPRLAPGSGQHGRLRRVSDRTLLIGGESVAGDGEPIAVENPFTTETIATVGSASAEQLDAAVAAAREAFETWSRTPALERGELLHEVARRLREGGEELARTMTVGGRQAADREPRRDRVVRGRVRLLRRDRPRQRRPRDPADRVDPARDGRQGPARGRRLHRPLELPAAAADLEGRAGARGRLLGRREAVGDHAALDARARRLLLAPPRRRRQHRRRRRRRPARRSRADERVDCIAFTGSVATGRKVALACADRLARVNLEMGGKDPFIVCSDVAAEDRDRRPRRRLGGVPQRRAGLHLGRALLRR